MQRNLDFDPFNLPQEFLRSRVCPPADQHKGSGKALIDGTSRIHDEGIVVTTYQCPK